MTQKKKSVRSSRPKGKVRARASSGRSSIGLSRCPSCQTETQSAARFCHVCGASLNTKQTNKSRYIKIAALVGATAAGIFLVAALLSWLTEEFRVIAPNVAARPTIGAQSATGIDLSSMSPRQAADRLFNRVMVASERGDEEEALRFAPMAVQAYGRVAALDADAHYHLGLLHLVVGDLDSTREEILELKGYAPNHLLAYFLEHEVAEQNQDQAAADQAFEAFAAAYKEEISTARPEYTAHLRTIERFRAKATGPEN